MKNKEKEKEQMQTSLSDVKPKKSYGARNRIKGHGAERFYVNAFKSIGFNHCVTARYGSRIHDDAGIDLINLPFNVQIKAGKQKAMNPSKVLTYMKERIKLLFPPKAPEQDNINIVIHKKEVGQGKRRTDEDELVHMTVKDFKRLITKIQWE